MAEYRCDCGAVLASRRAYGQHRRHRHAAPTPLGPAICPVCGKRRGQLVSGVCLRCRETAADAPCTQWVREQQDEQGVFAAYLHPDSPARDGEGRGEG